jgi:hypothetical protein
MIARNAGSAVIADNAMNGRNADHTMNTWNLGNAGNEENTPSSQPGRSANPAPKCEAPFTRSLRDFSILPPLSAFPALPPFSVI